MNVFGFSLSVLISGIGKALITLNFEQISLLPFPILLVLSCRFLGESFFFFFFARKIDVSVMFTVISESQICRFLIFSFKKSKRSECVIRSLLQGGTHFVRSAKSSRAVIRDVLLFCQMLDSVSDNNRKKKKRLLNPVV